MKFTQQLHLPYFSNNKPLSSKSLFLLGLLALAAVAVALPITTAHAQTSTSQLTVTSQDTNGNTLSGYYTILYGGSGNVVSTGYTPTSFTLNDGQTYTVQVDDYGSCYFSHWSDTDGTSASRQIVVNSNTQITAIYSCGASSSSLTVRSVNQNGASIFGYYTVLYGSAGNVISTGYTAQTFSTTAGDSYSVEIDGYGSCNFAQWADGSTSNPRSFTASGSAMSFTAVFDCGASASLSQSGTSDCIGTNTCTVTLSSTVNAGDVLLVFVPGYSFNTGWQAASVTDSLGNTFVQYQEGVNWQRSSDYFSDYAFYAIVSHAGSSDSVTITYNSATAHSDPVVMDVTGPNLAIYSGNAVSCTNGCTSSIATSATPVSGMYFAGAEAYGDLGGNVNSGGWTEIPTAAYYMTAEYTTGAGTGSTTFPFTDSSTPTTWGDAGIVVVSSATSTITVSTVNGSGTSIYGYYISIWQNGAQISSCFSTCAFTVTNGQTYQIDAASYGSETFSHWQDGTTATETVVVPSASTTIALTATYSP
jgi:hypothetical protein